MKINVSLCIFLVFTLLPLFKCEVFFTIKTAALLAEERQKAAVAFQRLESISDSTQFSIAARVA